MASYFITGASRGLGLDLVRELVNKPVSEVSIVYAGARTRTEGLEKLSSDARGQGVTTMDDLNYVFNVNVTGVHILIKSLLPLLKKGNLKKIINYSSGLGSITRAPALAQQDSPSYKVAKAALNMLTVQYALAMADEGFTIVVLSPGWVKTDLGGGDADLEIEASTKAVLDIVHGVGKDDNGKFLNIRAPEFDDRPEAFRYAGDEIPW